MRTRFLLLTLAGFAAPALALGACGPSVETNPYGNGGAGGGYLHGSSSTYAVGGADGGPWMDALPDYVDPGCPDAGPPGTMFQCDPYNQKSGDCAPGEGCYIFVDYPMEPCGQEIYGAVCLPVGQGMQGSPCGGAQDCGAGFSCVVSGSGNQCVQLCPLQGQDNCPPGFVCEPLDVQGFGGCL
jgi:hypothetical protein